MTSTFVLIMTLSYGFTGEFVKTAEFSSRTTCEIAGTKWVASVKSATTRGKFLCTPK